MEAQFKEQASYENAVVVLFDGNETFHYVWAGSSPMRPICDKPVRTLFHENMFVNKYPLNNLCKKCVKTLAATHEQLTS